MVPLIMFSSHFYRPQRSWAKVISLQASVCPRGVWNFWGGGEFLQFFGGGEVSEIFGGRGSPILGGLKFSVGVWNFLLGCTPPPWDGQCTAGTHPTGMHSSFRNANVITNAQCRRVWQRSLCVHVCLCMCVCVCLIINMNSNKSWTLWWRL